MLLLFIIISCKTQKQQEYDYSKDYTKTAKYTILEVDSTENYYIFKTNEINTIQKTTLVVEKKSKQLKKMKIIKNINYQFSTYSLYDMVFGGNYCHDVEGKRVWCSQDSYDLRFTETMGNENDTIIDGKLIVGGKLKFKK